MVMSAIEIAEEWSKDAIVDETSVAKELLRTPKLHAKYVKWGAENSLMSKKRMVDFTKLRAVKWEYYGGKMSKEDLDDRGWKPFLLTVTTRDGIERYIEKDEDLSKILLDKAHYDEAAQMCRDIVKELNSRTYALRAWVDYQKYLLGN